MKSWIIPSAVIVMTTLVAGCADGDDASVSKQRKLPEFMKFTGGATGVEDDITIDCLCDLNLELTEYTREEDGTQKYVGLLGGEIHRAVTSSDGSGLGFSPFLFGQVKITVHPNDSVYLSWPGNLDTGVAFYDNISLFKGVFYPVRNVVKGEWKCAPFEIDEGGYIDLKGTATGEWMLQKFE